jgi:hypothetical protein
MHEREERGAPRLDGNERPARLENAYHLPQHGHEITWNVREVVESSVHDRGVGGMRGDGEVATVGHRALCAVVAPA